MAQTERSYGQRWRYRSGNESFCEGPSRQTLAESKRFLFGNGKCGGASRDVCSESALPARCSSRADRIQPCLFTHHEGHETVRKNRRPWTRIVCRRGGTRTKLRRHHEHVVRFGIESQRSRSLLGGHVFGHAELVRRFLFHNSEHTVASARSESEPGSVVECSRVDSLADRRRGENLAAIGVDHCHHLVVAAHKQAAMLAVDREPAGLGAGRKRPLRFDFQLAWINRVEFALVF